MALPVTPWPEYPDVPPMAGVPQLPGFAAGIQATNIVAAVFASSDSDLLSGVHWGVYDDTGANAFPMASFYGAEEVQGFSIPIAPLENGAFTSYNKVQQPREIRVRLVCDGSLGTVASFIAAIEAAIRSLDLYSVVTPDASYVSMNPVHQSISRSASSGASMVAADLVFQQVRITAQQAFTQTATPAGQPTTVTGGVQTSPVVSNAASSSTQSPIVGEAGSTVAPVTPEELPDLPSPGPPGALPPTPVVPPQPASAAAPVAPFSTGAANGIM